ncbi:S-layer homology domain-containing protein [Dermabacteraceae bacterium P13138]
MSITLPLAVTAHAEEQINQDYTYNKTVLAGETACALVHDPNSPRLYLAKEKPQQAGASVTWLGTDTLAASETEWALPLAEVAYFAMNSDGSELYTLAYRAQKISVTNPADGSLIREITSQELPKFPKAMLYVPEEKMLYVSDSKANLFRVNPATGEVSDPVQLSNEKYPGAGDIAYDSKNKLIWMAIGKDGTVSAYSTVAHQWVPSATVNVGSLSYGGEEVGGRVSTLAVDSERGLLYAGVHDGFKSTWATKGKDKIVTIDIKTKKPVGPLARVGEWTLGLKVNPVSHELYSLDKYTNSVSVMDPETRTVRTIDFTKLGVTPSTGNKRADSNVCDLSVSEDGRRLYVSHPFNVKNGSRVSIIDRAAITDTGKGETPAGPEPDAQQPGTKPNENWEGPARATAADAPAKSVSVEKGTFTWGINNYTSAWETEPLGKSVNKKDAEFNFDSAQGWVDVKNKSAELTWADGLRIDHYRNLVPELKTWLGTPVLKVNPDGSGTLSMDVKWTLPKGDELLTEGYKRVTVATFKKSEMQVTDDTVTITATPDYEGRTYQPEGEDASPASFPAEYINNFPADMRRWWYQTGASQDSNKAPLPLKVVVHGDFRQQQEAIQMSTLPAADKQVATDVPAGRKFSGEIQWMLEQGISTGWDDGSYRPLGNVSREAMAAFLYRLAGSPEVKADPKAFTDISRSQFVKEITWMRESGISTGWSEDNTFRPGQDVNRDAMAAFLHRFCTKFPGKCSAAVSEENVAAQPDPAPFNDVKPGDMFADDIKWLAKAKITTGWEDGNYQPLSPIKRDAMAAFIYRLKNNYLG